MANFDHWYTPKTILGRYPERLAWEFFVMIWDRAEQRRLLEGWPE